jgi:hypothetical protein
VEIMSEPIRTDDDQRARARAWRTEQARKTFAEIDAREPGHGAVSEAEVEQAVDDVLAELDRERSVQRRK